LDIKLIIADDHLLLIANGNYSLPEANHLFKQAIDKAVLYNRHKILIDVTNVTGSIPYIDRFYYSKNLAEYSINNSFNKANSIAVVGKEPIVDKDRFGETVAVNRGLNVRVFTDMEDATMWLNSQ
jgi:hypothetical protein